MNGNAGVMPHKLLYSVTAACVIFLVAAVAYAEGENRNSPRGADGPGISCFKDIQAGPVRFDFGAQARVRYERYGDYTIKRCPTDIG
jgi:hypothetical protein